MSKKKVETQGSIKLTDDPEAAAACPLCGQPLVSDGVVVGCTDCSLLGNSRLWQLVFQVAHSNQVLKLLFQKLEGELEDSEVCNCPSCQAEAEAMRQDEEVDLPEDELDPTPSSVN